MLSRIRVRQEIAKLHRLDPDRVHYSIICAIYKKVIQGLRVGISLTSGELFYRVRRNTKCKPRSIIELGAPPVELVTGYQRCNPPNVSMFYASSRPLGALVETRVEVGDIVYLSEWTSKRTIRSNTIFSRDGRVSFVSENGSEIRGPNDDIILSHFDAIFTKLINGSCSNEYKFTSAIANLLTENFRYNDDRDALDDGYVALKYPSVHNLDGFYNTAINAISASDNIKILKASELYISGVDGGKILYDTLDESLEFPNGTIKWSENS